jgi:hypothetical protein
MTLVTITNEVRTGIKIQLHHIKHIIYKNNSFLKIINLPTQMNEAYEIVNKKLDE